MTLQEQKKARNEGAREERRSIRHLVTKQQRQCKTVAGAAELGQVLAAITKHAKHVSARKGGLGRK